jgi:hypothetical protein
LMKLYTVT